MHDAGNEGDFGVLILDLDNDEVDKEAMFFSECEASNFWMKSRLGLGTDSTPCKELGDEGRMIVSNPRSRCWLESF